MEREREEDREMERGCRENTSEWVPSRTW
jgi:hypothetical protein